MSMFKNSTKIEVGEWFFVVGHQGTFEIVDIEKNKLKVVSLSVWEQNPKPFWVEKSSLSPHCFV